MIDQLSVWTQPLDRVPQGPMRCFVDYCTRTATHPVTLWRRPRPLPSGGYAYDLIAPHLCAQVYVCESCSTAPQFIEVFGE